MHILPNSISDMMQKEMVAIEIRSLLVEEVEKWNEAHRPMLLETISKIENRKFVVIAKPDQEFPILFLL